MIHYIKTFLSFSLGTWFRVLINLISTPIISYLVIPDEFGKASMFTLVYNIALIVSLMGLDQSFIRHYYTSEEKNKLFWNCILLPIVLGSTISSLFVAFDSLITPILYGKNYSHIGILFSVSLITGILQRFNQLSIRAQKRGILYSAIDVVNSLGNSAGTILFALTISKSFYAIIFGQIVGNTISLVVGFIADRETRKLSRLDVDVLKENLKFALPILPATLLSWFAFSIDRISLRQYSSFKELGLYSAAFKVVSIMSLVQAGFTSFWIPVAYEKFEVHGDDSKSFFKRANQIVSFVMFSFGFLILIFKDIIFLFFSKSYREASTIVPFLIFQPVMNTISETTVLGINLTKKTHWHTVIMGITCFANFIGNQILVPIFGARGAAISTGLSYVLFFTLRTAIAERLYPIKFDLKRIYTGILILFVVALSGTFLESSSVFFLLSFIGMLFVLFIYKNEFTLLKEQLKKLVKRKSTF